MSEGIAAPHSWSRREFLKRTGLGVGALSLLGAGRTLGAKASQAGLTTVVDQLGWLKLAQWGGYFAAQSNGYYAKQGLTTSFLAGGPNISAWQTLAAGRCLICEDDPYGSVVEGIVKGAPLIAIGTTFQSSPYAIMSLASDPIDSVQAMSGKTVAVGASNRTQVVSILQKHGVKNVNLVPAGPDPTQLVTKQVQGYFGFFTAQGVSLQQQGLKIHYLTLAQMGVPSYSNLVWVQQKTLQTQKDLLIGWMKASVQGWEYSNANPTKVGQLTAAHYGPPGDKAATEIGTAQIQAQIVKGPHGVMGLDAKQFQGMLDGLYSAKIITKPLKAEQIMTTEILDAVYKGKTSIPY
jgi:NitT/TauT family transport system substrate-binding protein